MNIMHDSTIIWDFDGTILPLSPYDSEQSLLLHHMAIFRNETHSFRRWMTRVLVYGDRKEWFKLSFRLFKWGYVRALKGARAGIIDDVASHLAPKISGADRKAYHALADAGYRMVVISCGTVDLSQRVLAAAELADCFGTVVGNRFRFKYGGISGMDLNVLTPEDKVAAARAQGIDPARAVAVGDGYSDLPLLDSSPFPILMDRTGMKRVQYQHKNYHFSGAIPEIPEMLGL